MSINKYANLPDIDTAPDVYETEDSFPSAHPNQGDSSDDDAGIPARAAVRKTGDATKEDIDSSNLISPEEASKKFRKAERRRDQIKTYYTSPPSPTDSPDGSLGATRQLPLSQRLHALQAELSALETELADPSNPQIHKEKVEGDVDPGELIRGLVDVRGRLDKIRKGKEGRGRLVGVVLGGDTKDNVEEESAEKNEVKKTEEPKKRQGKGEPPDVWSIVEMDRRVGELEKLVGSSSATLDEASPLPPPLLPLITRLNTQLTLLTQPRHIDSISRRLKLLLSDLDRASASQHHSHRRQPSQPSNSTSNPSSQISEQVLPLLTRLGPSLPHIPHILARLRTLSALHTSAGEFQSMIEGLEEEQRKMRESMGELEIALKTVEQSLEDNRTVVRSNVGGLDGRVDALLRRLDDLEH